MGRALERSILGHGAVVGLRSISRQRTPRRPRSMASVRPTGPAPATITSWTGNGVPPSWVGRLYHPGRHRRIRLLSPAGGRGRVRGIRTSLPPHLTSPPGGGEEFELCPPSRSGVGLDDLAVSPLGRFLCRHA